MSSDFSRRIIGAKYRFMLALVSLVAGIFLIVPQVSHAQSVTGTITFRLVHVKYDTDDGLTGGDGDTYFKIFYGANSDWSGMSEINTLDIYGDISDEEFDMAATYSRVVTSDSSGNIYVRLELWEYDSLNSDEHIDISDNAYYAEDDNCNIVYNMNTHTWSGDTTTPACDGGSGEDNGKLWFYIQSDPDNEVHVPSGSYGTNMSDVGTIAAAQGSPASAGNAMIVHPNGGVEFDQYMWTDNSLYYRVFAVSGQTVGAYIRYLPDDYDFYLYKPDNTQACSSLNGGTDDDGCTVTADQSGYWTIEVYNWGGDNDWFSLDDVQGDLAPGSTYLSRTLLTTEGSGSGYLIEDFDSEYYYDYGGTRYDDTDNYAIYVEAGEDLYFAMTPPATGDFNLRLYNPSGAQSAGCSANARWSSANGGTTTDYVQCSVSTTGYWTAQVYHSSGYGRYTYSWYKAPTAPSSITPDFQETGYAVWLDWAASTHSSTYNYDLDRSSGSWGNLSTQTGRSYYDCGACGSGDSGGLTQGSTYYWRVRACDSSGHCSLSFRQTAGITIPDETEPPSPAVSVSHVETFFGSEMNQAYLSWPAVSGAASYNIYSSMTQTDLNNLITSGDTWGSNTQYAYDGLHSTSYYWGVSSTGYQTKYFYFDSYPKTIAKVMAHFWDGDRRIYKKQYIRYWTGSYCGGTYSNPEGWNAHRGQQSYQVSPPAAAYCMSVTFDGNAFSTMNTTNDYAHLIEFEVYGSWLANTTNTYYTHSVNPGETWYYRGDTMDSAGNLSFSSSIVSTKALDRTNPTASTLTVSPDNSNNEMDLSWTGFTYTGSPEGYYSVMRAETINGEYVPILGVGPNMHFNPVWVGWFGGSGDAYFYNSAGSYGTYSISSIDSLFEDYSLRLDNSGDANAEYEINIPGALLKPNTTYIYSGYQKITNYVTGCGMFLHGRVYYSDGTDASWGNTGGCANSGWTRDYVSFTTANKTITGMNLYVGYDTTIDAVRWIDGLILEEDFDGDGQPNSNPFYTATSFTDTDATDNTSPDVPAKTGDGSTSHNPTVWSADTTIDIAWTAPASNGDDYFYYLAAIDSGGNEDNLMDGPRSIFRDGVTLEWSSNAVDTSEHVNNFNGVYSAAHWVDSTANNIKFDTSPSLTAGEKYVFTALVYLQSGCMNLYVHWRPWESGPQTCTTGRWQTVHMVFTAEGGTVGPAIEVTAGTDVYITNYNIRPAKSATVTTPIAGYDVVWDTSSTTNNGSPSIDVTAPTVTNTSPARTTGSSHYAHVKAVDGGGNWSSPVHFGPFYIDVTKPVITFNSPAAASFQNADFNISISDSDAHSGLASCEYMVENMAGATWSTTRAWTARTCNNSTSATIDVSVDCPDVGINSCRVSVRSTDNVGNVADTVTRTFSRCRGTNCCASDADCGAGKICVLDEINTNAYLCYDSYSCRDVENLPIGTVMTNHYSAAAFGTGGGAGSGCGDHAYWIPSNPDGDLCVVYDVYDADGHVNAMFTTYNHDTSPINSTPASINNTWYYNYYRNPLDTTGNFIQFENREYDTGFSNVMYGYSLAELGETDGTNSTGCCDQATDCVDDSLQADATDQPGCYNTGVCHDTGSTASTNEYCDNGTWRDNDYSQATCDACVAVSRWNLGGEVAASSCCGDDANEYANVENTYSYAIAFDNNEDACCNAALDCVAGSTCYTAYGSYNASGRYTNLNPGGNDNKSYCYNGSGGVGKWLDCDQNGYMNTWCYSMCGGTVSGGSNSSCLDGTTYGKGGAISGESAAFGEYTSTGQCGCCGDDIDENAIAASYDSSIDGSPAASHACCNAADKCSHLGTCYANGNSSVDVDSDGDTDYCDAGTWKDCADVNDCPSGYYCSAANECVDLPLCTEANAAGSTGYNNQEDNEDLWNDCSASWDACASSCVKQGPDGYCDGAGACDTNDATANVAQGMICSGGSEVAGLCNSSFVCSDGEGDGEYGTGGYGYYVQGLCDGGGSCDYGDNDPGADDNSGACECEATGTQGTCGNAESNCWMSSATAGSQCCEAGDDDICNGTTNGYGCIGGMHYTDADTDSYLCLNCDNDATSGDNGKHWGLTGDITTCCGDDAGEYSLNQVCDGFACTTDAGDTACCNAADKCVEGGLCYADGVAHPTLTGVECVSGTWEDATPPVVDTVIPADTDYNNAYLDEYFNLSANVSDNNTLQDGSCEYYCSQSTSLASCNGTWQAAADNFAGTDSSGTCQVTGESIQCTDGETVTLNIRVKDNAGQLGTGTQVTRICDTAGPVISQILPTADIFQNTTAINSGDLTCSDSGSGLTAAPYHVLWCNDGASKGGCSSGAPGAPWQDTNPVGYNSVNDETFGGTAGNWYRMYGSCIDNLGNESELYSTGYILVDTEAPDNVASVNAWDSSSKNEVLADNTAYSYDNTTPGPYFEWTDPADNPASPNSGILGYFVYFGNNISADPSTPQARAATNVFTNSLALTSGSTYYLRIKTRDNAGNVSAASTLFTYKYSSGAYIKVTTSDEDNTSYGGDLGKVDGASSDSSIKKLEGVLTPDNTDFEIVSIYMYDEWDSIASDGTAGSRSITVTLEGVTTSGAYISATNLGGATPGGTSVTGTMTSGQAWVKVKATSTQTSAIYVAAAVNGGSALSNIGGRTQKAPITIGSETSPPDGLAGPEDVNDLDAPVTGGTVMHPVWNHAGNEILYAARKNFPDGWNLYKVTYMFSTTWSAPTRLTNTDMCVQPHSKYSFSSDDSKVLFSARPGCATNSPVEMYAVNASGADSSKTFATLESENKHISNGDSFWWWDVDWNSASCGGTYADRLLVTLADMSALGDVEIFMVYGLKNSAGLFTETGTGFAPVQVTDIGGGNVWNMQAAWSPDCNKLVFTSWEGTGNPKTGIYMIDLNSATLPITSLSAPGVTKVHECSSSSCTNGAALYPSFSADGSMIAYQAAPNTGFDIVNLIKAGSTYDGDLVTNFFTGANFDNYLEYILDQPTFAPQLIGMSSNNEFGLVQCSGPSCPNSTYGNQFAYITLNPGQTDGSLKLLTLGDVSTISANGGLLFYQGTVAAVFPTGSVSDPDLEFSVASAAPTVDPIGTGSQDDLLVNIGESREFFPDGVTFSSDVQLIFQYCDRDDNGFMDVNQDAGCPGGTDGDSYDEDMLYVYFWCESASLGCTANSWARLEGSIDPVKNTITVATNHFSRYDVFALNRGRNAPQTFVNLSLNNLHTFPNPWRTGQGDITFYADSTSTFNSNNLITVEVHIFDTRGRLVRSINATHADSTQIATSLDAGAAGGYEIARWDARNNSGSVVASNVYLYLLRINDGVMTREYKGKLAIVR